MTWLHILGWYAVGLATLGVLAFAWTGLREREWRAVGVSLLVGLPVAGLPVVPLLWPFPGNLSVLAGLLAAGLLVLIALLLPIGRHRPVRVVGNQPRLDERDALFHRFYQLAPGTAEYEAYYRDQPELQALDDKIRALPHLGAPGSKAYHPLTAPYAAAMDDLVRVLNQDLDEPVAPLNAQRPDVAAEDLTRRIKGFAQYLGADRVGCTALNPAYVYTHIARGPGGWGTPITLDHPHAIAIAVEMRHQLVRQAPAAPTLTESSHQYLESTKIAVTLAHYIQRLGWQARAHVDQNYRVLAVPIAVDAGLGELGRLGLLMTPEFGPRVRLSVVTTDLPLVPDQPVSFGAAAFCEACLKCAQVCPSGAISTGPRQVHAGVEKWQSRMDTCYRYWRTQGTDCALCIRACPYAHPRSAVHDLVRWLLCRSALARRAGRWAEDLVYGRQPGQRFPVPPWHAR